MVHKFQAFPFELYDLLEQSMPFYHMLNSKVKKRNSSSPSKLILPNGFQPVPIHDRTLVWVGNELLPCEIAKVCQIKLFLQKPSYILNH
jgi:protein-lysine N-methyltransferase EEF2KMT